jgi:hypothetical protein
MLGYYGTVKDRSTVSHSSAPRALAIESTSARRSLRRGGALRPRHHRRQQVHTAHSVRQRLVLVVESCGVFHDLTLRVVEHAIIAVSKDPPIPLATRIDGREAVDTPSFAAGLPRLLSLSLHLARDSILVPHNYCGGGRSLSPLHLPRQAPASARWYTPRLPLAATAVSVLRRLRLSATALCRISHR